MKITQGFVAATPDGQFVRISSVSTMSGYRNEIDIVPDIEHASVSGFASHYDRKMREQLADLKTTWVPVEVRREVILKGYGNGPA